VKAGGLSNEARLVKGSARAYLKIKVKIKGVGAWLKWHFGGPEFKPQ
jgi:hypothetical protein